jgi:triose/dihydroxyacetone kinase / FAD-AMP lyase (cyclizing)
MVGRRGLAGTVFTYKIAGALATKGADIDEVYGIAKWVSERLASIAMGLEHCHVSSLLPVCPSNR